MDDRHSCKVSTLRRCRVKAAERSLNKARSFARKKIGLSLEQVDAGVSRKNGRVAVPCASGLSLKLSMKGSQLRPDSPYKATISYNSSVKVEYRYSTALTSSPAARLNMRVNAGGLQGFQLERCQWFESEPRV